MTKVTYGTRGSAQISYSYRADVKATSVPTVTGSRMIGGKLHYITDLGKKYVAEVFDRVFGKPAMFKDPALEKGSRVRAKAVH